MCVTYSVCVSAFVVIQHAMHLRHFVVCGLPGSTVFLLTLSQNCTILQKKVVEHKKCVLILSSTSVDTFSF
jgi:hypothetical protein